PIAVIVEDSRGEGELAAHVLERVIAVDGEPLQGAAEHLAETLQLRSELTDLAPQSADLFDLVRNRGEDVFLTAAAERDDQSTPDGGERREYADHAEERD